MTPRKLPILVAFVLALAAEASCKKPVTHYPRTALVGEYWMEEKHEGLVLRRDDTFVRCWVESSGAREERGGWWIWDDPSTDTTVTLDHASGSSTDPGKPWMEGLMIEKVGDAIGLLQPPVSQYRYYVKVAEGRHACGAPSRVSE